MWRPISREDFERLYAEQRAVLSEEAERVFERFRVPLRTAVIRRSEQAGDERVFVVAESPRGVLYFDDVEYGFFFSPVDEKGRILERGAAEMDLADSIETWLSPQINAEQI